MDVTFSIPDKNGKKVHLSNERYKHLSKHPKMHEQLENIKQTIQNPNAIRHSEEDKKVVYFYKEFKENNAFERYLLVAVKYLNREGFIITSFFTNKITGIK